MAQQKALVDKLLTNVSSGYFPKGYIAESVLPKIAVTQQSGLLGKYGMSHLRVHNTIMGGRGGARRVDVITRETQSYLIDDHGLEGVVTPSDYRNVEKPFDAEKDEVIGLTTALALGKEKALSDVLGNTAILTQNVTLAGVSQFNDYASSDPIGVFKTARLAVWDGCGEAPNTAIMPWDVMNTLAYHPGILDALGYAQNRAGQLSEAELAKALGVEKLLVAKSKYNASKEGQTDSLASTWGKNIVFAVLPESAMPYQVSLGYYVVYSDSAPRKVYKYDIPNPPETTGLIVTDHYDMLISNSNAAFLVKNSIA